MKNQSNNIGFTGARAGLTKSQRIALELLLAKLYDSSANNIFHHGDCVGADEIAHAIAKRLGYRIVIHPPRNNYHRAFCNDPNEIRTPRNYLIRNQDIVNESRVLIVCPAQNKEILRSGTWSTVRKARKAGVRRIIIRPKELNENQE